MSRRRPIEREAGYNLVFLVVFFALLSVMAAAVLPAIKKQIQREKEAELIFRGLQYAEAIRVFQQRFGRSPNAIEELLEVEPRSIRQLWDDPMSADGRWAYVFARAGQPNQNGGAATGDAEGRDLVEASAPEDTGGLGASSQGQVAAGPIIGVVSRKKGVATRTFLGKGQYEEWRFTADILPKPQVIPGTSLIMGGNVTDLGKPFPYGLVPATGQAPQGGDLAGGDSPDDLFDDEGDDG